MGKTTEYKNYSRLKKNYLIFANNCFLIFPINKKHKTVRQYFLKKAIFLQNALTSFPKCVFFLLESLLLSVYIWCRDEYLKRTVDVDLSRFEELLIISRKTHFIFHPV